jgi:hypothetical protein
MKLENQINVQPPPYSDNSGQIITPDAIVTNELEVVYADDPKRKTVNVTITHFPLPVTLLSGDAYKEWTKADLESKLKDILGSNPSGVLRSLFPKTMEEEPNGPGTQLARMIKTLGIHMSDSCSCRRHAINMNEKGNDWCAANIDTVVGWLREESQRRGLPFVDMVGKVMVNRAVKKSRKLLANQPVPENDEDLDKED